MQFEEFVGINVKILNPEPICNNGRNEIMAHEAVKYLKSWFAWNYLAQLAALFSHLFKKKNTFRSGVIRLSKRMTLNDLFINFCIFALMTGLVWSLDHFQKLECKKEQSQLLADRVPGSTAVRSKVRDGGVCRQLSDDDDGGWRNKAGKERVVRCFRSIKETGPPPLLLLHPDSFVVSCYKLAGCETFDQKTAQWANSRWALGQISGIRRDFLLKSGREKSFSGRRVICEWVSWWTYALFVAVATTTWCKLRGLIDALWHY